MLPEYIRKNSIKTDHTMKELTEHGTNEYPIMIISKAPFHLGSGIISWHWHEEFELLYLESGKMHCSAGSEHFLLRESEAIFINSRILHQMEPYKSGTCVYSSYVFSSRLLFDSVQNQLYTKYLLPLSHNDSFPFYIFTGKQPWETSALAHIHVLNKAACEDSFMKDYLIFQSLHAIFIDLIQNLPEVCTLPSAEKSGKSLALLNVIHFINTHYMESITLTDIAASASISKSTCNRLFQEKFSMSPIEYLLEFRINQSIKLLMQGAMTVTETAEACGFHDTSYFCKIFREKKGKSPGKYIPSKDYSGF